MSGPQRYHEILQMIHDANVRMMWQIDEMNRRRRELEDRVGNWRTAPTAREFPGVGTFRWACNRPTWSAWPVGSNGWFEDQAYAITRGEIMIEDVIRQAKAARR